MNIRVTDAEGRLLASGRDLEAIRRQLGAQAAESFSQVDDPRWNRDGLTDWDFDDLPAEIELPRGRLSVKAYPALLDRGDSVSLRLVDSPQRAEHETRFGLRRLCLLAAQRELKSQVDWLPNLDKMKLHAATLAGFDLRGQLAELLADRAMVADQPLPRTKDDFERLLAAGRERIGWAVQEVLARRRAALRGLPPGVPCRRGDLQQSPPQSRLAVSQPTATEATPVADRLAASAENRRPESPPTDAAALAIRRRRRPRADRVPDGAAEFLENALGLAAAIPPLFPRDLPPSGKPAGRRAARLREVPRVPATLAAFPRASRGISNRRASSIPS